MAENINVNPAEVESASERMMYTPVFSEPLSVVDEISTVSARCCGALYPEGAGYIADCQNALNHQRVSSEEFLDELKIFVRKKHQELDMQEEAVYQQLLELQGNNS